MKLTVQLMLDPPLVAAVTCVVRTSPDSKASRYAVRTPPLSLYTGLPTSHGCLSLLS
jgi:hypothetical protein